MQLPRLRVIDRTLELKSGQDHEGYRSCSTKNYKLSIHDF